MSIHSARAGAEQRRSARSPNQSAQKNFDHTVPLIATSLSPDP